MITTRLKHVSLVIARTLILRKMQIKKNERPIVCSHEERSMSDEVGIDCRISGLPHSVVKQVDGSSARELIKKIENHPHRQDLQFDVRQNKTYNPFGEKSRQMIQDMGNVALFELCETNPKNGTHRMRPLLELKASSIELAGIY